MCAARSRNRLTGLVAGGDEAAGAGDALKRGEGSASRSHPAAGAAGLEEHL